MASEIQHQEPLPENSKPVKTLQMQAERNEAGQFLRSQSGNRAGWVAGTRNRATMIVEQLFDGSCPGLAQEALTMARGGDSQVMRQILGTIIGLRRHRASSFARPPLNGAADVAPATAAIAAAAAEGEISTSEAVEMSQVVERYQRPLEAGDIHARLKRWRAPLASPSNLRLARRPAPAPRSMIGMPGRSAPAPATRRTRFPLKRFAPHLHARLP